MDSLKILDIYPHKSIDFVYNDRMNYHGMIPGATFKSVNGNPVVITIYSIDLTDDDMCWIFSDGNIEEANIRGGFLTSGSHYVKNEPTGYKLINYPSDADIEDWYVDGVWKGFKIKDY